MYVGTCDVFAFFPVVDMTCSGMSDFVEENMGVSPSSQPSCM